MIRVTVGDIEPDLRKLFGGAMDLLYVVIRQEAIDAIQAPVGVSKWPVVSGLSKSSFDAEIRPPVVSMTNATTYAKHVEERTGAARSTLSAHFESTPLVNSIDRVLQQHFEARR